MTLRMRAGAPEAAACAWGAGVLHRPGELARVLRAGKKRQGSLRIVLGQAGADEKDESMARAEGQQAGLLTRLK